MNNKNNKKDIDKKIKFRNFIDKECKIRKLHSASEYDDYSNFYKIFGLYKYNPKISHWKNFCNRLKWPLSHEKLKDVIMTRGDKIYAVIIVSLSMVYAFKGGPKYPAF
jgi:hypothetical protein